MSIRIEITTWPRKLRDLEDLCRVAREQGFTDEATVGIGRDGSFVSIHAEADDLADRESAE